MIAVFVYGELVIQQSNMFLWCNFSSFETLSIVTFLLLNHFHNSFSFFSKIAKNRGRQKGYRYRRGRQKGCRRGRERGRGRKKVHSLNEWSFRVAVGVIDFGVDDGVGVGVGVVGDQHHA